LGSDHNLGAWQRISLILALEVSAQWKSVLVAIAQHEAMKDGVCRASVTTLAKRASVSRRWLGRNLSPMETAGLIAIDERRNGAAPVIEVLWERLQGIYACPTREPRVTSAHVAHVGGNSEDARALYAQVSGNSEATRAVGAQVELTEPSLNPLETVTRANGANFASNLRKPDAQPAQIQHEPAHAVRTSALVLKESGKEECGSRLALTPPSRSPEKITGSTLPPEEIAARQKFCRDIRPDWAKKGDDQ
jgi:hypothetical protein